MAETTTRDPPAPRTAPAFVVPPGACDCHVHVIGPLDRYPQTADRPFTVAPVPPARLLDMQRRLGLQRVVLVAMVVTGTDNSYLADALAELGPRARGVAVVPPDIAPAALTRLDAGGFRAARVLLRQAGDLDRLLATATQVAPHGWHVETYGPMALIAEREADFAALPNGVVFDHLGGLQAARGMNQPGFSALLRLVAAGKAYVKLSGAYRASSAPPYAELAPFARALIEANPERLLWGSDWPHPAIAMTDFATRTRDDLLEWFDLDDGALLNLLPAWTADPATQRRILSGNPQRLYRF